MKKIIALVLALVMVAACLTACGGAKGATLKNVQKAGKLVIATSPDFPPFESLEGGEVVGIEPDIMKLICYVKKLCDDTQFILITHRRGTMEIGDRLYGVTMPQRGISQAIELNVNEIEGKQEELLDGIL